MDAGNHLTHRFVENATGRIITVVWSGSISSGIVLGSIWRNYSYPQYTRLS